MTPTTTTAATPNRMAPQGLWWWIPSLYFGQGIPYVVVMTLSVIMYKKMGVSNTDIALYTSWLYLPWVIKPLWSPFVDLFRSKRFWIVSMQLLIGVSFGLVGLTVPLPQFFQVTLVVFWLMAFASATHDIAADGYYMLATEPHQQAAFVGVRSTCFRLAMIAGQGGLVFIAGWMEQRTGQVPIAWALVFGVLAVCFLVLCAWHQWVLPRPASDVLRAPGGSPVREFFGVFASFLRKPGIGRILAFLLLYRLGEAQLLKLATPFMLDAGDKGGLGLTTQQVGIVYGTIGILCLTVGGLLGGYVISRHGLKRWLWPMVLAINVPHLVYVYMALALPSDIATISVCVAVEQLGYGFGFAAYLLYMIMVSDGPHKTAHYAICTGFMALGMMLPGMASGWLQSQVGYAHFFIWVCLSALPAFIAASLVRIAPEFGRKAD